MFWFLCLFSLYNFWFCKFIVILLHFDTISIIVVLFNGATRGSPILWVHDSSIIVAFGGPFFDILTGVPYSSCSVTIGFVNQEKIVSQVPSAFGVGSMDWRKNVVQVGDFSISKFGEFKFVMDLEDSFWNTMFEKELPKYKDWLDTIFFSRPLEIINVNTTSNHVFNHLQNWPISITYVVDPNFLPS